MNAQSDASNSVFRDNSSNPTVNFADLSAKAREVIARYEWAVWEWELAHSSNEDYSLQLSRVIHDAISVLRMAASESSGLSAPQAQTLADCLRDAIEGQRMRWYYAGWENA